MLLKIACRNTCICWQRCVPARVNQAHEDAHSHLAQHQQESGPEESLLVAYGTKWATLLEVLPAEATKASLNASCLVQHGLIDLFFKFVLFLGSDWRILLLDLIVEPLSILDEASSVRLVLAYVQYRA